MSFYIHFTDNPAECEVHCNGLPVKGVRAIEMKGQVGRLTEVKLILVGDVSSDSFLENATLEYVCPSCGNRHQHHCKGPDKI